MAATNKAIAAAAGGKRITGCCNQEVDTANGVDFNFAEVQSRVRIANPSANFLYYQVNTPDTITSATANGIVPAGGEVDIEGEGIKTVTCLADTGAITPGITGWKA